jgi:transposase, IS5 family
MVGQPGFFDRDERYASLSAAGDPLARLAMVVDFELLRPELEAALARSDRAKGGRPPYDEVLMCKVLVLQTLYTLSDDQTEYQIKDRLSFMRFLGLALEDRVPDAKTIWLFREQLTRAGAVERLFERFDAALRDAGYLAMGGQIVDATVIQARRPRLTRGEKATIKGGGVPAGWSKAKRAQMDTEGRWTLKRGRRRSADRSGLQERTETELVIPVFGYKNHLGIDRRHGFIRSFVVTNAATHDGRQLGRRLDPDNTASVVWADCAYARRPTSRCWRGAGSCPNSSGRSRAARRCRRTSCAATPAGRACGSRSRTCSRPRNAGLAWSSARSAWPGPRPGSGSPIWSPTCAAWSGARRDSHRPESRRRRGWPGAIAAGRSSAGYDPQSTIRSPHAPVLRGVLTASSVLSARAASAACTTRP